MGHAYDVDNLAKAVEERKKFPAQLSAAQLRARAKNAA
jgi:hypothetical protein